MLSLEKVPLFATATLALGAVGLCSNVALLAVICLRTPRAMLVYSRILAASAACDLAGVLSMMITVTKEKVYGTACILEYHGICMEMGREFCCAMFAVQEHMYTSTCLLLNLSFAYRLRALRAAGTQKKARESTVVTLIIVLIIAGNSPLIPLYRRVTSRDDPMIEQYRNERGLGSDQQMGISNYTDLFTLLMTCYSVLTSVLPLYTSVLMKQQIVVSLAQAKGSFSAATSAQHAMLIRALNLQLLVSSCFLTGCAVFGVNFLFVNLIPGFPESTEAVVPLCNLQNVASAISNLYAITPYRRYLTSFFRKESNSNRATVVLNLSHPSSNATTAGPISSHY